VPDTVMVACRVWSDTLQVKEFPVPWLMQPVLAESLMVAGKSTVMISLVTKGMVEVKVRR